MSERTDESVLTDILTEYLYKLDEIKKDVSVGVLFMETDLVQIERMLSGDKFTTFMNITSRLVRDDLVIISEHLKYRVNHVKSRFGKMTIMIRFESIPMTMKHTLDIYLQKKRKLDSIRSEILDYAQGAPLTPQLVYQNLFRNELGATRREKPKSKTDTIGNMSKGTASMKVIETERTVPFSVSDIQEYLNVLCLLGLMKRKGVNYYPR